MCKTKNQYELFKDYKTFISTILNQFEACTISRRATAHLIIPKFYAIIEALKAVAKNSTDKRILDMFCTLTVDLMNKQKDELFTNVHFMTTLLAPGHRKLLNRFYDKEFIQSEYLQHVELY